MDGNECVESREPALDESSNQPLGMRMRQPQPYHTRPNPTKDTKKSYY
jgi:hypothetical protein